MKKMFFLTVLFFTIFSLSAQSVAVRAIDMVLTLLENAVPEMFTLSEPNIYVSPDRSITVLTDGEVIKTVLVTWFFEYRPGAETYLRNFQESLNAIPGVKAAVIVPSFFSDNNYIYLSREVYVIMYPPMLVMRNSSTAYRVNILFTKDFHWYFDWLFK